MRVRVIAVRPLMTVAAVLSRQLQPNSTFPLSVCLFPRSLVNPRARE